jgi:hypothetical protein
MKTVSRTLLSLLIAGALQANNCLAFDFPGLPFFPGGSGTGAAIAALAVYILATHIASEEQRRIADQRAARAYARMSAKRRAALKANKVRYIAVDTKKDQKTSAGAQKSVMVWDTEAHRVASDSVYDVKSAPSVGSTARFDKYSAEYVGSGG